MVTQVGFWIPDLELFLLVNIKQYSLRGVSLRTQVVKNPNVQCRRFNPWIGKDPWRKVWKPTPVSLLGKAMDRGAPWATVCGVAKSWTRLKRLSTHSILLGCLSFSKGLSVGKGILIACTHLLPFHKADVVTS